MIDKEVPISIVASEYFNVYKASELKPKNPKFEYSLTFTVIENEASSAKILLNKVNEFLNFNSLFFYFSIEV
ncbi:hypothetical protein HZS_2714 [Henneguya salminicola]|nr:hypothetical protein HZS_2714 [Henneguya salminicola]